MNLSKRNKVIGKDFETNNCGKCFVVDYKSARDITVIFYEPFYVTNCEMSNLRKGEVCNPFYPKVYGKGYVGVGKYDSKTHRGAYNIWKGVLQRVYTTRHPSYNNTGVCNDWHNFQNFADWCYSQKFFNAKDIKGKSYHLDKDILNTGIKIYSPETCCFVPSEINGLLIMYNTANKPSDLPLGVKFEPPTNGGNARYSSKLSVGGRKNKYLGYFNTQEDAFQVYKEARKSYIKEVAEKWKGKIDDKVYKTLISWELLE